MGENQKRIATRKSKEEINKHLSERREMMNPRKIFHDSVVELPEQTGVTATGLKVNAIRPEHGDKKMTISFSLAIPQDAHDQLEAAVAKGEVVSLEDLNTKYAVSATEVDPLISWLKAQGYEITHVSKDRTSVFARATATQIEQSLGVQMVRVTKDGITYTAARNAPSLPAEIADSVHAIIGLQPYRHAHKQNRRVTPKNRYGAPSKGKANAAAAPAPNVANAPPYLVSEVLKAYNANDLPVTGKGQVIAILIDTFPADEDLEAFWQRNNISTTLAQIEKINVDGGPLPPTEGEETLDVEWASGIAPGARVRVYASGSLEFSALDRALDSILSDLSTLPGMRQLSMSLGLGETFMQPGEIRTQHQKFLRLAAAGVNVFVSSGDAGSNPDNTGHGTGGPLQAEYSSSDSAVIGVGGSTLVLAANGSVTDETGWADGGGGKSSFFDRPAWQKGPGVPEGTQRLVPDVSLTADPNEGGFVFLNGQPQQFGGTSWSAPIWAGFCALMNEARMNANKPLLPFLNPLIYPLIGTSSFRDIVVGNNGAFDAGTGYDMVTGIGVPNVKELIGALTR
jgi:kumamolisin